MEEVNLVSAILSLAFCARPPYALFNTLLPIAKPTASDYHDHLIELDLKDFI